MLKRTLVITMSFLLLVGLMASPAAAKMKAPVVTLETVEIAHIWPYDPKTVSVMDLAFIFAIQNPNRADIKLEDLTFTMAFDGFDLDMPMVYEDSWIPGKKTNYLRVHATFDTKGAFLVMMVPSLNVDRWKKMGAKPKDLIKKWWTAIVVGDFAFPIEVKYGAATFVDKKGKEIRAHFSGKWPK